MGIFLAPMIARREPNRRMVISSLWLQVAIVTFLAGFAVLLYLAYRIHAEPPPIPGRVVAEDGSTLFTGDDIMAGQHIFQKYGLMQYGTIFGHGAYLGPDFTAQYLHEAANAMVDFHRGQGRAEAEARQLTSDELKQNRFDPQSDVLHYTASQTSAFHQLASSIRAISAPWRSRADCGGRPLRMGTRSTG